MSSFLRIPKVSNEHPELKSQVIISLIADFDPYQASMIYNDGKVKKMVFSHNGGLFEIADEFDKGEFQDIRDEEKLLILLNHLSMK